jgi:cytochrome c2
MHTYLLRLSELLIVLLVFSGFLTLITTTANQQKWQRISLVSIPVLAILFLFSYWNAQTGFRAEDAVFWGRMMSGDGANLLSISCLGILLAGGFSLAAMSLGNKLYDLLAGSACFIAVWVVIYWHPTPHYVPMSEETDNTVWLILLSGTAIVCLLIYSIVKKRLEALRPAAAILSGIAAMVPLTLLFAHINTSSPIDLKPLSAKERLHVMGCLSCHTINGMGYDHPGGALESVASRSEDALLAFMLEPSAENAKTLKIRETPTGEMAGVHLTEHEAHLLTGAMKELFEVKPPTMLGPGNEYIEILLTKNNCLACHSIKGQGAPEGGLGKPLEDAAHHPHDVIVKWMMNPSAAHALELGIRTEDNVMGAMDGLSFNKEDSEVFAKWLTGLHPQSTTE